MTDIDEGLYSRQLYAVGMDAMKKMTDSIIFIDGSDGLGVEIAKNCILTGFKKVIITGNNKDPINISELGTNYYLTEEDVGKCNRLDILIPKLRELNPNVIVEEADNNCEYVADLVIFVNKPVKYVEYFSKMYDNTKFIYANTYGLVGQIFCDFKSYNVVDIDGEQLKKGIVKNIDNKQIHTLDRHRLQTGDLVRFERQDEIYTIKFINKDTFELDREIDEDIDIKYYTQVKKSKFINHKSFVESLKDPEFVITDFTDFEKPHKLHKLCFGDSIEDKELTDRFNHSKKGTLTPINSIIGGIVAQEVIKCISQKYIPISQWLYFDGLDCLPDNYRDIDYYSSDRYEDQIKIFGKEFQKRLSDTKYFIVGAGAIGCELLKNFSMIGLGDIIITDMDIIERSNLNRQFLFRPDDINKPKSTIAKEAVNKMNPYINVTALTERVGQETENIFNKEFYDRLDGVANALDNIQARLYMDERIITYKKPLLESGTLGAKCNVQVILPDLTESYSSNKDPSEEVIPMCTLKHFPNMIEHCIQWAKDEFYGLFVNGPMLYSKNDILADKDMYNFIKDNIPKTFDDCIQTATKYWFKRYNTDIKELLKEYPKDKVDEDNNPFWSNEKRCPSPLAIPNEEYITAFANIWWNVFKGDITPEEFEKDDPTNYHINFITSASNQRAKNYGIEQVDYNETKRIAGKIIPALATTTSVVAGLVTLELYKLINNKPLSAFKNTFVNMALNFYGSTEPFENKKIWKREILDKRMTINDILNYYQNEKGIELDYISYGSFMLHDPFSEEDVHDDRYIEDIIRDHFKDLSHPIILNIGTCEYDEELPNIHYYP